MRLTSLAVAFLISQAVQATVPHILLEWLGKFEISQVLMAICEQLYVCTFWSTRLKLREVDIKKQAQRQIGIAHGASTIEAAYLVHWSVSSQNYRETTGMSQDI